jgi:endonuclease/exonuclease/phosphatase family metal-dependent hydrolase
MTISVQETHLQDGKPFKIRGYQVFRNDRQGRKKGVMTLIRNNINTSEITTCTLDLVNYYCPNDKSLDLDTIQVTNDSFLITGDFNSQSQSWGYDTLDKRGEEIETWQDEDHLILINDPSDEPTFYSRRWHSTTTPDLALCTEDIHKRLPRKVGPQFAGSDHYPVLLHIHIRKITNRLSTTSEVDLQESKLGPICYTNQRTNQKHHGGGKEHKQNSS